MPLSYYSLLNTNFPACTLLALSAKKIPVDFLCLLVTALVRLPEWPLAWLCLHSFTDAQSCFPLKVGCLSFLWLFGSCLFCTSQLILHLFYEGLCSGSQPWLHIRIKWGAFKNPSAMGPFGRDSYLIGLEWSQALVVSTALLKWCKEHCFTVR